MGARAAAAGPKRARRRRGQERGPPPGAGGRAGVYRVWHEGAERLATENLVPGNSVYRERLVGRGGAEYRLWDPFRSKLAAAILNGMRAFPLARGSRVLYLGASTGTTVSHVSDIVGPGGVVFGVEHASRVARDFLDRVASRRPNVVPVMSDARRPGEYASVFGKADVVYSDIAQPDQTAIAMSNCRAHLRAGGDLLMVVKTRSIDVVRSPASVIDAEIGRLRAGGFEVAESVGLSPYDKDHAMVHAVMG